MTRRIAVNIAKLPDLLPAFSGKLLVSGGML